MQVFWDFQSLHIAWNIIKMLVCGKTELKAKDRKNSALWKQSKS